MGFSHKIHPAADSEFTNAYIWYENQQPGLGDTFANAVSAKITEITQNPFLYGSKSNGYRETLVDSTFPYIIVYQIDRKAKVVFIAAIFHERRDPGTKYRRRQS